MTHKTSPTPNGSRTHKDGVIILVIPTDIAHILSDPYFPQLIQGAATACDAHSFTIALWLAEPEYERRMISQMLDTRTVSGVVVANALINDSIVNSLYESKIPFLSIGRHPSLDVNYVDADNVQAACEATLHLLQLGRKRIATITGPQDQVVAYERYHGFLKAMQEQIHPVNPELVVEEPFTETGGYEGMQKLLPVKPDAVFAASDVIAYGAMRAIREAGLRVPEDVAIVGFDDIPGSAEVDPPLTTIRQSVHTMGKLAVETLIDIIAYPESKTRHVVLSTQLVVRSSCGGFVPSM